MNKDESNELLEIRSFMKHSYSALISNAGKIIATITLAMAVLLTFTDLAFSDLSSQAFTTQLCVMLLSSYLMYFSLEDSGEKEGEQSEEYKSARQRYLAAKARITPKDIDSLRQFCLDYSIREQEYRRLSYLAEMGLSESEYLSYKSGKVFSRRNMRVFSKADKIRAVNLTPHTLLSSAQGIGKSELEGPAKAKLLSSLISLIPSTVCMVFTVSVMLTTKDGMTVSSVIEGLLKLSALPIIGFRGMLDGYKFAKEEKSAWLETKARLLESFLVNR